MSKTVRLIGTKYDEITFGCTIRNTDECEITWNREESELAIEAGDGKDSTCVFLTRADAIELRDFLNHALQGTRPAEKFI